MICTENKAVCGRREPCREPTSGRERGDFALQALHGTAAAGVAQPDVNVGDALHGRSQFGPSAGNSRCIVARAFLRLADQACARQFGAELDGMGIGYPLSDVDTAMGSGSDFENAGSDPPTSPATSPLIGMWSAWRPTTVAGSKRLQQAVESIKGEAHSCPWPGCTFVTAHKV